MTDDKLREVGEELLELYTLQGECTFCGLEAIQGKCGCPFGRLRAALADSATADKGTQQRVAKNCPECGGVLWPLVENGFVDQTRRKCRRCDRIYQVAMITATANAPPSTNPDTNQYLLVAALKTLRYARKHIIAEASGGTGTREVSPDFARIDKTIKRLETALAAAPKVPWKDVVKQDEIIVIDENGKVHLPSPPSTVAPRP